MDLDTYRQLRSEARRHTRKPEDSDDLLQDALLIALENGRDDPAWLCGVIRNQATMQARSAIRRRRREAATVEAATVEAATIEAGIAHDPDRTPPSAVALLERLPPAARRVAVLALHGLNAEEIRRILGLSATAFRQRLTSIRKTLAMLAPAQRAEAMALAYIRDPARSADLQFGLVRRTLIAAIHGTGRSAADGTLPVDAIGTHDADGHLLILRGRTHTSPDGGNE
ncbi:MAG: sigma-70 family RNA polymerase sigma factor [Lysobacter sp.]|nr:sigma-70 family RNA polymerase sigma factor [Lysobacter sp.]